MFPLYGQHLRPNLGDDSRLYWDYDAAFFDKILDRSPIAYWPLWEADGSTAEDISGNGLDGEYSGVTLGAEGIGDGNTSPSFNGSNALVNIHSVGLNSAFNGQLGTFIIWLKALNAGVWTDGTTRDILRLQVDANNYLRFGKESDNGKLLLYYNAGGTFLSRTLNGGLAMTDWWTFGLSWSKTADRLRYYIDGIKIGTDKTGLGSWAGNLDASLCKIANSSADWKGWAAHCALFDTEVAQPDMADMSEVS